MLRKAFLIAACSALLIAPASAADLKTPVYKAPVINTVTYNWSGFYAGINGGWGNSQDQIAISGLDPIASAVVGTGVVPSELRPGTQGWVIGGQIGYNWQFNRFVVGAEADIQWSGIDGSASQLITTRPLGLPIDLRTQASTSLDWFGTVTGRAGYLLTDTVLLYAKGGLAYGSISHDASISLDTPIPVLNAMATGSASDTKFGWTVGAGVEMALNDRLRARLEYSYMDLGSTSTTLTATVLGTKVQFGSDLDHTYHLVRGGLSYAF